MWKSILAAVVLSLPGASALAQADPAPPMTARALDETRPLVDGFFQTLQGGDAAKAYNDLFADTLMAAKAMEVQNLVAQTNFIFQTYGPSRRGALRVPTVSRRASAAISMWSIRTMARCS